jgi:uncharacterized protein (TIGR02300 family)
MSTKVQRGTKRTCQNLECGSRFYDLNRDPITCPICNSVYELATSPVAIAVAAPPAVAEKAARKPVKKPVFVPVDGPKPDDAQEVEGEELVAIEGEEEPAAAEDDETFLEEEEEDGADVSGIIGGPVADTDETT